MTGEGCRLREHGSIKLVKKLVYIKRVSCKTRKMAGKYAIKVNKDINLLIKTWIFVEVKTIGLREMLDYQL